MPMRGTSFRSSPPRPWSIHREDSAFVGVGHGRYLAENIAGARYVELPGADTLYWVGDTTPVLAEIEEFVTGSRGGSDAERVLTTIVFTDIVGSTRAGRHPRRRPLARPARQPRHRGPHGSSTRSAVAKSTPPVTVSSRRSAAPASRWTARRQIVDAVAALGIEVRVGIHAGEVEVRGHDIAGMAVHIGARVAALAGPSEVLVSSTVREIVTGSHRTFTDRGEHRLKGVPGTWCVYAP